MNWIYYSGAEMPGYDPESFADRVGQSERLIFMQKKEVPLIIVYGRFPAPFQEYGLWYSADFGDALQTWRRMRNMLFLVSGAVTFVLALFLVKFLDILFKPLREISVASRVIAEGDYHARLHVKGRDEIAVMADNFNRMAEQVESHIQMLQDTAEQKQRFVDDFAHELRTPLTAIYGYTEYLQKASVSEKEHFECTQFILSECRRLQNMAYQLLDLAALREVQMETFPVEELFQRVCGIMQVKAKEKGITLSASCCQERVEGNMELLITFFSNLVDNALKAGPEDLAVRLSASEEGDKLILEVRDRGMGMTKEQLVHIKEAFYRVDRSRSRAAGGAGLGLSICDRIARLHHGELTFLSQPGEGTTARLILPKK